MRLTIKPHNVAIWLIVPMTGLIDVVICFVVFGFMLVVSIIDWLLAMREAKIKLSSFRTRLNLSIHKEKQFRIWMSSETNRRLQVRVFIESSPHLQLKLWPETIRVLPDTRSGLCFTLNPLRRGAYEISSAVISIRSPCSFWSRLQRITVDWQIYVYPDFAQISEYLELVNSRQTSQLGLKRMQKRGTGLEFHQLRNYRQGDAQNLIDWNATSKRRELITRDFEEEKNQNVVFLLDCGRRMRSKEGDLTHFDHALNAMILVAYLALRQGDFVAVMNFGNTVQWNPPRRGQHVLQQLLEATMDIQPSSMSSDYVSVAEEVLKRHSRRALVVLITDLREEDYEVQKTLELLQTKHLVLLANLYDSIFDEIQKSEVDDFSKTLELLGSIAYMRERNEMNRHFRRYCKLVLHTPPARLPIDLANAYLAIKKAGYL